MPELDINFVRQHFPAFNGASKIDGHFFDSAAGSFPCQDTIDALTEFYTFNKVQPGNDFPASTQGMEKMLASKNRWAMALNVEPHELGFGPSTTQNIYVLAKAFSEFLNAGDEIIVTNQDHESNTGVMRRFCEANGIQVKQWQVDSVTGLLEPEKLAALITDKTRLICFPHASNIAGQKNDAEAIINLAKQKGVLTLVDGVSYVPHEIPDLDALGADIYVFSLYKVYSVHLGVMVVRAPLLEVLPRQGHFFKHGLDVNERLVPAGPDHAQIGAAGAVLDYVETLAAHHGGPVADLRQSCEFVSGLWRHHERVLVAPLLDALRQLQGVRVIGSFDADDYRCPLVSISPVNDSPADLVHMLCDQNILVSAGHYYAPGLLEGMGIDPDRGVVRFSMAHYNSDADVQMLISKLESLL